LLAVGLTHTPQLKACCVKAANEVNKRLPATPIDGTVSPHSENIFCFFFLPDLQLASSCSLLLASRLLCTSSSPSLPHRPDPRRPPPLLAFVVTRPSFPHPPCSSSSLLVVSPSKPASAHHRPDLGRSRPRRPTRDLFLPLAN
jgi:hypothetical protein